MKILFFAPSSAVWVHAFPKAVETRALKVQLGRLTHALHGDAPTEPVLGTLRQRLFDFVSS